MKHSGEKHLGRDEERQSTVSLCSSVSRTEHSVSYCCPNNRVEHVSLVPENRAKQEDRGPIARTAIARSGKRMATIALGPRDHDPEEKVVKEAH